MKSSSYQLIYRISIYYCILYDCYMIDTVLLCLMILLLIRGYPSILYAYQNQCFLQGNTLFYLHSPYRIYIHSFLDIEGDNKTLFCYVSIVMSKHCILTTIVLYNILSILTFKDYIYLVK